MIDIFDYISGDKTEPTTRVQLKDRTGLSDRDNRSLIMEARTSQEINPRGVILSSSSHPGYWISEDTGEIDRFIREQRSRIKILASIIRHCERFKLFHESMSRK